MAETINLRLVEQLLPGSRFLWEKIGRRALALINTEAPPYPDELFGVTYDTWSTYWQDGPTGYRLALRKLEEHLGPSTLLATSDETTKHGVGVYTRTVFPHPRRILRQVEQGQRPKGPFLRIVGTVDLLEGTFQENPAAAVAMSELIPPGPEEAAELLVALGTVPPDLVPRQRVPGSR